MPGQTHSSRYAVTPRMLSALYVEFHSGEDAAGHRGAVDVAGVTEVALVEVSLIAVEDIVDSGVELQGDVVVDAEVVGEFQSGIEKAGVSTATSTGVPDPARCWTSIEPE